MAECQYFFNYSPEIHSDLALSISDSRLDPYLQAVGGRDHDMAIKLYLWNARIAKSFLFPLQIAEVTARNAMHTVFSTTFGGERWMMSEGGQLYARLNRRSKDAIDQSMKRLVADGKTAPAAGDVISALTFDFWSNLFRNNYQWLWDSVDGATGQTLLLRVFPHAPAGTHRSDIQQLVKAINHFRNRVAHHEPVHQARHKHEQLHNSIIKFIAMRCPVTSEWVKRYSTVPSVIRTKPTEDAQLPGKLLNTIKLMPPAILTPETRAVRAIEVLKQARPSLILIPAPGKVPPFRVLTSNLMLTFIGEALSRNDGLLDLSAITLSDIVSVMETPVIGQISVFASTGDATAMFFPNGSSSASRPLALLVIGPSGDLRGVITRPDFRF